MTVEARKPKSGVKAPRLPKVLPLVASAHDAEHDVEHDATADGDLLTGFEYHGLNLAGRAIARLHFDTAIFTQMSATDSQCDHLRAEDVRFSGCNLANAAWSNLSCCRAEFI
ncbi:MAG TPA: hypothetical protein VID72_12710, partial [Ktedonobacterales bacterium]